MRAQLESSDGRQPIVWCPTHPEATIAIETVTDDKTGVTELTVRCCGKTNSTWCDVKSRINANYLGPFSQPLLKIYAAIQFQKNLIPAEPESDDEETDGSEDLEIDED